MLCLLPIVDKHGHRPKSDWYFVNCMSLKHQCLARKILLKAWKNRKNCHQPNLAKVIKLNLAVIFIVVTQLLAVKYHTSGSEATPAL